MKRVGFFNINKILYLFAIFILSFTNTIPVQAVSDFYSENNIQFYDPEACDPNGGNSDDTSDPMLIEGIDYDNTQSTDTNYEVAVETDGTDPNPGGDSNHQPQTSYGHSLGWKTHFIALNPEWDEIEKNNIKLGDVVKIAWKGKVVYAIYGDNHSGGGVHTEVSLSVKKDIGAGDDTSTGFGSKEDPVKFTIYPGTSEKIKGNPPSNKLIDKIGIEASGGISKDDSSAGNCICSDPDSGDITSLDGNSNIEKVFNFLTSEQGVKLDTIHAAAIIGNFIQESNVNPESVNPSSGATGIAQWLGGRLDTLKKQGGDQYLTLEKQLEFLIYEMKGPEKAATDKFLAATTIEEATRIWGDDWERAGQDEMNHANRLAKAKIVYRKYKGSTTVSSGSTTNLYGCSGSSSSESGEVGADGYAFPIGLSKSEISNWGSPWCTSACHHDGTEARDVAKKSLDDKSIGVSVLSIVDGTIDNQHIYNGISGCYSLQLIGKDGWHYYYTHIRSPKFKSGDKVKAGQKIAEIGERKCTGNGSAPHLHIDRGSPKGRPGGSVCCRDVGFKDLINNLYNRL